jgi:flagellar basal-body rod protein FlgB
MTSKIDDALSYQSQALGLRAYRQQVLAANIANADTPNYKARDFDFASALKEAVAGRAAGSLPLARTNPAHLKGNPDAGLPRQLYRIPTQTSADGNTVEMDAERAGFAQNAIGYEASVTFVGQQIRTLLAAVQG